MANNVLSGGNHWFPRGALGEAKTTLFLFKVLGEHWFPSNPDNLLWFVIYQLGDHVNPCLTTVKGEFGDALQ